MQFRRAEAQDKARILEICEQIWEGHDYLPKIIDHWLIDRQGEFTVMVEEGQVMAVGKMTLVEPKVGWLEGLRVAPEARSRGLAKKMTKYYLEKGLAQGLDQLRLCIYFDNQPSLRLARIFGFKCIADFFHCQREVDLTGQLSPGVDQLHSDDQDYSEVLALLQAAPQKRAGDNLLGYGWLFKKLSSELLVEEAEQGHIYFLREDGSIQAAVLIYPDYSKDQSLYIPLITGTENGIEELLNSVHYLAHKRGLPLIQAMVPESEDVKPLFLQQGFCHWLDIQHANVSVYQMDIRREKENYEG